RIDPGALIERARELAERGMGPAHPALVAPFIRVGRTYLLRQEWATAYRYFKRASEIAQHKERYFKERTLLSNGRFIWNEFATPYPAALKTAFRSGMFAEDAGGA